MLVLSPAPPLLFLWVLEHSFLFLPDACVLFVQPHSKTFVQYFLGRSYDRPGTVLGVRNSAGNKIKPLPQGLTVQQGKVFLPHPSDPALFCLTDTLPLSPWSESPPPHLCLLFCQAICLHSVTRKSFLRHLSAHLPLPESFPLFPAAFGIKLKVPGLAPKIVHDLAPAAPPACFSPLTPQHPQLHSSGTQIAVGPQTSQLFLTADHLPVGLALPGMPLPALLRPNNSCPSIAAQIKK